MPATLASVHIESIREAANKLKNVALRTPIQHNQRLSDKFDCDIYLKREDLQIVRSYKIRGAYNKISSLSQEELAKGIVCASAGNHAQGVAYACKTLNVKGRIYMPIVTPKQKVDQTKFFGQDCIEVELVGDTYDDSYEAAQHYSRDRGATFVHPFDDLQTIAGQATVGLEIVQDGPKEIDYIIAAIGGGGLASGVLSTLAHLSPNSKLIGVEPAGAPAMLQSINQGELVTLKEVDTFVDGAAVRRVGNKTFEICKEGLHKVITVPENHICQTILDLYNRDAIVAEPAGAMAITALDYLKDELKNKKVVCLVGGGNNDIVRMAEIKERALLFNQVKHYFIVRFPQRPGALREFVAQILGPNDDITHFEFSKKSNREKAPAIVGVELASPEDLQPLIDRMKKGNFFGEYINDKPDLFQYLI